MFGKSVLHDTLLFGFRAADEKSFRYVSTLSLPTFVVFFRFSFVVLEYIRENSLQLFKMLDKLPVEILRMVIQEVGFSPLSLPSWGENARPCSFVITPNKSRWNVRKTY